MKGTRHTRIRPGRKRPVPWNLGSRKRSTACFLGPGNPQPAYAAVVSGYRYYSPELGRWTKRDPIGEQGGVAVFGFCWNKPTLLTDGLGLLWGHYSPLVSPSSLLLDLALHWFYGGGRLYHWGADIVKGDKALMATTQLALENRARWACSRLSPGSSSSDNIELHLHSLNPQESMFDSWFLKETLGGPNPYFQVAGRISARKARNSCCCMVSFRASYRWRDIADMHPDRWTFPDSFAVWYQKHQSAWYMPILNPLSLLLPPGKEFPISIGWTDKSVWRLCPVPKGTDSEIRVVKCRGWPCGGTP